MLTSHGSLDYRLLQWTAILANGLGAEFAKAEPASEFFFCVVPLAAPGTSRVIASGITQVAHRHWREYREIEDLVRERAAT